MVQHRDGAEPVWQPARSLGGGEACKQLEPVEAQLEPVEAQLKQAKKKDTPTFSVRESLELMLRQNNAIEIYEENFTGDVVDRSGGPPSAKTLTVFRDPSPTHKRTGITGLVREPAPRIEQLGPLDCALDEDVLLGRLVPGLVVLHEHRPAAGLYLDRWQLWIVPGEMARGEAQAPRAAAGVTDTLTTVLDALLASAVAVIEKDTLFRCVAEQIVERLPEGRRHFGHLCKGPQRVVCGDGSCLGTCRM